MKAEAIDHKTNILTLLRKTRYNGKAILLQDAGLMLEIPRQRNDVVVLPKIYRAGDGRTDISTASDMRAEKAV